MKFSHELTYDAPPEAVHAMLADPAFREQVCAAMHSVRTEVRVEPAGAGMQVVVDQTQPARGIPSFAKKFVGDEIQVVQKESWNGTGGARLDIEIPGKPSTVQGRIALTAAGAGTVQTVSGDVKVSLPLVGGKLEGLIGELLRSAFEVEQRVGRRYLAGS